MVGDKKSLTETNLEPNNNNVRRRQINHPDNEDDLEKNTSNNNPKSKKDKLKRIYTLGKHYQGPTISVGLDIKMLLIIMTFLFAALQVGVMIYIIVIGRYDLTYYTYWNYIIVTGYIIGMFFALIIEKWFLTVWVIFLWPLAFGSTLLVMIAILIIIKQNPNMLSKSMQGDDDNLGTIHTGDFFVHVLPTLELFALLISGWDFYVRAIIGNGLESLKSKNWRALYVLYWIIIPVVPMIIYSCFWSPSEKYPTGISEYILWGILSLVDILGMIWLFLCFVTSTNIEIESRLFWGNDATPAPINNDALSAPGIPEKLPNSTSSALPVPVTSQSVAPVPPFNLIRNPPAAAAVVGGLDSSGKLQDSGFNTEYISVYPAPIVNNMGSQFEKPQNYPGSNNSTKIPLVPPDTITLFDLSENSNFNTTTNQTIENSSIMSSNNTGRTKISVIRKPKS